MQRSHSEENIANESNDDDAYAFLNLADILAAKEKEATPPIESQRHPLSMTLDGSQSAYAFLDLSSIPSFRITDESDDDHYEKEATSSVEAPCHPLDMTLDGNQSAYAFLNLSSIPSFQVTDESNSDEENDDIHYEKEPVDSQEGTKVYDEYKQRSPSTSDAYSGFSEEIISAFNRSTSITAAANTEVRQSLEKPGLLSPNSSQNSSLSSSLDLSAEETMSSSGSRLFEGLTLFGSQVEAAKMDKTKKAEGSNGEVFELELYFKNDAEIDSTVPKKCAIKSPKSNSSTANNNLKKFFHLLRRGDRNLLSQMLIPYGTFIGKPSNRVYLCMPLADFDGDALIPVIPSLSSTEKDLLIKYITYSLIKAFVAMNELNVTHGDMKPSNIMFTAQGSCLINDFDTASIFGRNGEFLHDPRPLRNDRRFNPLDQLKLIDTAPVLNGKFRKLDAYRVGLSLLLFCIARADLVDAKLNLMKEQRYPSINQLLENALDNAESIVSLLNAEKVDPAIIEVITQLLSPSADDRLTIAQAWNKVKYLEGSFNETEIQALFAKINHLRKLAPEDGEKEKEAPTEETNTSTDIVVETTELEKIFQVADENKGEIEGDDMQEILQILTHEDPSKIADELSIVLDKYKKAAKTTGNLIAETGNNLGSNNEVKFKSAMEGFKAHRLLGNVKRALTGHKDNDDAEKECSSDAKNNPLAQSIFSAPALPRKRSGGGN